VNLEQMVLQVQPDLLEPMVCLESMESTVLRESPGLPDLLDLTAKMEFLESTAERVQPVLLVSLVNQEPTDQSDLQAKLELREPTEQLEHQDLLDHPDLQVSELQEQLVCEERLVNPV